MSHPERRHLYLPERDRSFWKADADLDVPLRYLAWGYRDFTRQPMPASRHEGWVYVLIEEGSPTMVVRRREVRMPAGTLAVIGPDCPFGWKGAVVGPSKFRLWMWRSAPSVRAEAELRAAHVTRAIGRAGRKPFELLHDLCRREVLRPGGASAPYLDGCRILFETTVQRTVLDLPADASEPSAGGASELSALAKAWLDVHLDSREPIARLCDYLDVSQSTLYRGFVEDVGMSPLAWFHRARMERARRLIQEGGRSVKETAYALGYGHANDLSRAYRKHFGAAPRGGPPRARFNDGEACAIGSCPASSNTVRWKRSAGAIFAIAKQVPAATTPCCGKP
jgi:AraC family transcriptional regulator of arabinose operon